MNYAIFAILDVVVFFPFVLVGNHALDFFVTVGGTVPVVLLAGGFVFGFSDVGRVLSLEIAALF